MKKIGTFLKLYLFAMFFCLEYLFQLIIEIGYALYHLFTMTLEYSRKLAVVFSISLIYVTMLVPEYNKTYKNDISFIEYNKMTFDKIIENGDLLFIIGIIFVLVLFIYFTLWILYRPFLMLDNLLVEIDYKLSMKINLDDKKLIVMFAKGDKEDFDEDEFFIYNFKRTKNYYLNTIEENEKESYIHPTYFNDNKPIFDI